MSKDKFMSEMRYLAGHGRNWGAGSVTGCYGPLVLGVRDAFGMVAPAIEFVEGGAAAPLPEGVVSLVRHPEAGAIEVNLYNGSEATQSFQWRLSGSRSGAPPAWSAPGALMDVSLEPSHTIKYTAHDDGEVSIDE